MRNDYKYEIFKRKSKKKTRLKLNHSTLMSFFATKLDYFIESNLFMLFLNVTNKKKKIIRVC